MMETLREDAQFTLLTPQIATDYLLFQKEYEGKDFLWIRNIVIKNGFTEELLCKEINNLRERRINMATIDGKNAFDDAFDQIFWYTIKDNS